MMGRAAKSDAPRHKKAQKYFSKRNPAKFGKRGNEAARIIACFRDFSPCGERSRLARNWKVISLSFSLDEKSPRTALRLSTVH